jgi:hypothetical protein
MSEAIVMCVWQYEAEGMAMDGRISLKVHEEEEKKSKLHDRRHYNTMATTDVPTPPGRSEEATSRHEAIPEASHTTQSLFEQV